MDAGNLVFWTHKVYYIQSIDIAKRGVRSSNWRTFAEKEKKLICYVLVRIEFSPSANYQKSDLTGTD